MNRPGKFKKKVQSPQLTEEMEERLHPNRYLGYNRDRLGVALLRREMFEAAASQFKRAVYLNPFEASFKQHLAWTLYRLANYTEALETINEALRQKPDDPDTHIVREKIISAMGKHHEPQTMV